MFEGKIKGFRVYHRVPTGIVYRYKYGRVDYWTWWRRLVFWLKETWLTLTGDNSWTNRV